jgi:hypothetical protein
MSPGRRFFEWFRRRPSSDLELWFHREPLPPIIFPDIGVVDRPPSNPDVRKNIFYLVSSHGKSKWVLFQCPCGCGEIVTLSLQSTHWPHWSVRTSPNSRASLQPSVWRNVGCMSHFWIYDGRVYWCSDSGTPPMERTYTS